MAGLEGESYHASNQQNQPPIAAQSSKRFHKADATAGSSSQITAKSADVDGLEDGDSFVTPAVFVNDGSTQPAPGAPRILLVNQQANADAPHQQNYVRSGAATYLQLMRTPPAKNAPRLYLRKDNSEQHRGFDSFERISDEIILQIFHYLPRHMMNKCALVCRRWARIVCDRSLWKQLNIVGRTVKEGVLKILLERGVEVLRLTRTEIMGNFSSTVQGTPDPCRSPLSEDRMYQLRLLDMSMANVKTSLLESMLQFCPRLCKISLENIPVTEQLLLNLAFGSPHLETINLCMCEGVTSRGLEYIFENCTSLIHLNVAWTCMSQENVKSLIKILPRQLLSLDISGNREKLSDEDVSTLCDRCPHLQELDLSDSTEITNLAADEIGSKLNELQAVSLSRCYNISPSAFLNLTNLPKLKAVNVFGLLRNTSLTMLEECLMRFKVNENPLSSIARPSPFNSPRDCIWNVSSKHCDVL
ncbi:hypothetical protein BsWGS_02372 [Bradybaena similaris]